MRFYIAGCGGMLGEGVRRVFTNGGDTVCCTDVDVNEPWLEHCDFREAAAYSRSVGTFKPDVLIHLGAHTDLEYCELNPADAYRTNTESVEHAAGIANALGIPLVYISTAGIFDGAKLVYDDDDAPNPLSVYARSKHLGEVIVREKVRRHYICRAGWMMGGGTKDKKFIGKLLRQLLGGERQLRIVDDKLGTPTYTVDFARNLRALLDTGCYGLYNMVCEGGTSRLEVAKELVKILSLEEHVKIEAVNSDYFAGEYFAPRPPSEQLVNRRLKQLNLDLMRDWRIALAEYIRDYHPDVRGRILSGG